MAELEKTVTLGRGIVLAILMVTILTLITIAGVRLVSFFNYAAVIVLLFLIAALPFITSISFPQGSDFQYRPYSQASFPPVTFLPDFRVHVENSLLSCPYRNRVLWIRKENLQSRRTGGKNGKSGLLGPLNSAGSVIFVKSPADLLEKFLKGNL